MNGNTGKNHEESGIRYRLPAQTFTKADRLLKRSEFLAIGRTGKRVNTRFFTAQIKKNDKDRSRLGITVSKRVAKATARNRIKRHAREYFRKNRFSLGYHLDINLIAKFEAGGLGTSKELHNALEGIFAEIQVFAKSRKIQCLGCYDNYKTV